MSFIFKCIVDGCYADACEEHTICRKHLIFEVIYTVVGGFAFVGTAIFAVNWLASR